MGAPDALEGVLSRGSLEDATCRAAAPKSTAYKLTDGDGMYLLVQPNGAKYWRLKYRHGGAEKTYAIGVYPEIGLSAARDERARAKAWLRLGKDPTLERRLAKDRVSSDQAATFRTMAEAWFKDQSPRWKPIHKATQRARLDRDLLPYLGPVPMKEITAANVLEALRRVYNRGAYDVVGKVRTITAQVFRYSAPHIEGLTSNAVDVIHVREHLPRPTRVVHRKRIPLEEMPELFEKIAPMPCEIVTKLALYFLIITVARTDEVRFATWGELKDGKRGRLWRVTPERRKGKLGLEREHLVPLSPLAIDILNRAHALRTSDGADALIFPGFTRGGSLSENALLALLYRAGYHNRQTGHGFRGSFGTWCDENEINPAIKELCLAHVKGGLEGAYSDAVNLPQRRQVLTQWAEQCKTWGMKLP